MIRYFLVIAAVVFLVGCAHERIERPQNVVMVHPEGWLLNDHHQPATNQAEIDEWLKPVYDGISSYAASAPNHTNVLIFIQGGLNSIDSGVHRANTLSEEILKTADDQAGAYPVFLAWDSRLTSSWRDHLIVIKGTRYNKLWTWTVVAPYNAIADIGRAAGRLFLTAYVTALNQHLAREALLKPFDYHHQSERAMSGITNVSVFQKNAANLYEACTNLTAKGVPEIRCDGSPKFQLGRYCESLAFAIPEFTGSVVVDTGGKAGWDQMLRRTMTMYVPSDDQIHRGGVDDFARGLAHLLETNKQLRITLIAHSMGAIIANEILREHRSDLHVNNIVYMGAACSVEEWGKSVIPFLAENTNAHFYNLSLHPTNERAENHLEVADGIFEPICPHGSLPEWIDDYYSYLADLEPSGATLGAFELAIPQVDRWIAIGPLKKGTFDIPIEIRDRNPNAFRVYDQLSFSCFGLGDLKHDGPQRHGDFSEVQFWNQRFWRGDWTPEMYLCRPHDGERAQSE
jgi:pimeloyl-ACP methyl ester carboxylesterase